MKKQESWIKRAPVGAFYLLAFAISWAGMVPQMLAARDITHWDHPLLQLLGAFGPALAAVIVTLAQAEKGGLRRLLAPLVRFRLGVGWYAIAMLGWPVIAILAVVARALLTRDWPRWGLGPWGALPGALLIGLFTNALEELGWRGFAVPRLQERWGDGRIALVTGALWYLWHLPLLLNPDSPMSTLPWPGVLAFMLASSVIYVWLYNHTGRSLVGVTLYHAMSNIVALILFSWGVFISSYWYVVAALAVWALIIWLTCGSKRFGRDQAG